MADPTERLVPSFLEEIGGSEALTWVEQMNEDAHRALREVTLPGEGKDAISVLEEEILEVLDSPDRIPLVNVRGQFAYNYWMDEENPRGLWRRMKLSDYLAGSTDWITLLDLDALAEEEGRSWVWHGAAVRYPDYDRALVSLSDGGSDADETREFDMETLNWVEGGFYRPEGKGSLTWLDRDTCWLSQPMGESSTSPSGYPLEVRLLQRGQELDDSEVIFRADPTSMGVWVGRLLDGTEQRSIIRVMKDFYNAELYLVDQVPRKITAASPEQLHLPESAEVAVWNTWVVVWLREDWDYGGGTVGPYPAGSLLAFGVEEVLETPEGATATVLFKPTGCESLEDMSVTQSHLVLTTIKDVVSKVKVLSPPSKVGDVWDSFNLEVPGAPPETGEPASEQYLTVKVNAVEPAVRDQVWLITTGYTTPSTLWLVDLGDPDPTESAMLVRSAPTLYEAQDVVVTQHFAVSKDGTKVPYFQVSNTDFPTPAPTLLYGYGGFNISLTPAYNAAAGRAWISRGGTYVVANIRGGGEYGPKWHTSALRENRPRAYEDFVAVARDLVDRGVTTTGQLGVSGGSNGGLLVGNMYAQYPDDFGAVLAQVPLLDMGRYHTLLAGHSWIAEYGDPSKPKDWQFLETFSPLHLFRGDGEYPPLMLTTSTNDDRVHPYHARALAYLAKGSGKDVTYYENVEGGHAGAANNRQRAHNQALGWAFLWARLSQ